MVFVLEDDRPFDAAELARVRIVAGHAELALANAERYVRAKERAFIDDCTEVYNARYLLTSLDHEVRRAERYGVPLSVLFIDLDRFKLVNDRHGHLVDAAALAGDPNACDRVDTLALRRDEFAVVLVDTGLMSYRKVAERIRRAVEDTPLTRVAAARCDYVLRGGGHVSLHDARRSNCSTCPTRMYRPSNGRNGITRQSGDDPVRVASPSRGPALCPAAFPGVFIVRDDAPTPGLQLDGLGALRCTYHRQIDVVSSAAR